jgi:hypothetical protein
MVSGPPTPSGTVWYGCMVYGTVVPEVPARLGVGCDTFKLKKDLSRITFT